MPGCLFQDNVGHSPTDGVGDARPDDCTSIGNASSDPLSRGGGFYLTMNSDPARVENCLVVGNSVSQGLGGGFFATAFGGSLPSEVKRTVMVGNSASFGGGAVLDHIADMFHCSFHSNTATNRGGGLYLTGFQSPWAPYATDCIVWGNTASAAPTLEQAQVARDPAMPGPPSTHYFDIEGLTSTFPGNGHIGLDPFFVDPDGADDVLGTVDDDLSLLLGSPCIDSGTGALDPDGTPPDIGALPFFQPPVPSPWVDLGFGLTGGQGVPLLVASGDLTAGSTATLTLSNANPFWVVALVLGLTPINAPFKAGTLVPYPNDILFFTTTTSNGQLTVANTWPPGIPSGFVFFGQFLSPDPGGPAGWSASNALAGATP